jgi:hypothetical protein
MSPLQPEYPAQTAKKTQESDVRLTVQHSFSARMTLLFWGRYFTMKGSR